ncbi:hypothetical protein [Nocardia sp. NPDC050793]|uniref:hypothetical protein n=1 Tax=Nocardia sp. NPDC050793 TaxID=3155159 RepID=UPI0033C42845
MANMYVLLNTSAPGGGSAFRDAVDDNGGRLLAYVPPVALIDGTDSTSDALQALVGDAVLAVGVENVGNLLFAAIGDPQLTELLGVLGLTTSSIVQAAELVRPAPGLEWFGFGCTDQEV